MTGSISSVRSTSGMKAAGASRPRARVLPADQRLDAGDLARGQVDLGLIVEDQLVAGDALAQVGQQRELLR